MTAESQPTGFPVEQSGAVLAAVQAAVELGAGVGQTPPLRCLLFWLAVAPAAWYGLFPSARFLL